VLPRKPHSLPRLPLHRAFTPLSGISTCARAQQPVFLPLHHASRPSWSSTARRPAVAFSTGAASSVPLASSTPVNSTRRRASNPKQGDIALKAHIARVCFKCFRCFRGMLQVFYADVTKVNRDIAYVANVSEACCKYFKGMLQTFVQNVSSVSDECCICFTHICRKSMFEMFSYFSLMLQ
jgi:hypothetical protein